MAAHVARVTDAILCHKSEGGHPTCNCTGHNQASAAHPTHNRRTTADTDERCSFIDDLRPQVMAAAKKQAWRLW
jgi:hypothetical protein